MKKNLIPIFVGLIIGATFGFIIGNMQGPRFASGYATGQLDLVRKLSKHFPHDPKNDSLQEFENIEVKDATIRVINNGNVKTLDVNY
ncbi:hypothetical protein FO488_05890 [Geobacter sp. FeAm09]|uniref:hypothetical protein n=1 Tax=Geobacter sp. FeAm09 TaxID=2597769 RepID=UPI0011EC61BC|nr:hypothetical protein [Geobacter sp. FeAm09]QEM67731.1 hypothetical protein FO488_05890 [Geobacter sp. FeAm09]